MVVSPTIRLGPAVRSHPAGEHGIAYTARHDDEAQCYALFDIAGAPVEDIDRETDLDRDWFWRIAEAYGVGFLPF